MTQTHIHYSIALPSGESLTFETSAGVFFPTATSQLCLKAFLQNPNDPGRTLDLGCGCGVVGIAAARARQITVPLYASDISESAVTLTRRNAKALNVECEARAGSLFEPWSGSKFETILDDVSGIVEDVAAISPWFGRHISCSSGPDGANLTVNVLRDARGYLAEGGSLYFPVISLSSADRILRTAETYYTEITKVLGSKWQLPLEMLPNMPLLRRLRSEKLIDFEEAFGMVLCSTEIYCAKFPKS